MNVPGLQAKITASGDDFSVAALLALVRRQADFPVWVEDAGPRTWADLGAGIDKVRRQCDEAGVRPGEVVVIPAGAQLDALAWLFGAASMGAVVAPLRPERAGEIQTWRNFIEIGWQVSGGRLQQTQMGALTESAARLFGDLRARGHPGLILATGGTTGTPKLVLHDLASLLATAPLREGRWWRLLPLMRFDHIGGLDMVFRALAGGQILVAPPAELSPDSVGAVIARHRVEVMPATPSFLNLLLMAEVHRHHDLGTLRVVPYGAEPMPAVLLGRLRAALPGVDFVQRFGTSETGALPVRGSGAGLMLTGTDTRFEWKVIEQELWVRSPARALGYLSGEHGGFEPDGWFRTGDLVEGRPDGTVTVLGRREEMINVGGEKVWPGEVEDVILTHPQVIDCSVGSAPTAILGRVVTAEIVWRGPGRDPLAVKRALHEFAAGRLARHKLPTVVHLVDRIDATQNLKKRRVSPA